MMVKRDSWPAAFDFAILQTYFFQFIRCRNSVVKLMKEISGLEFRRWCFGLEEEGYDVDAGS